MRRKFKIALVGRPNVGKSALFNRIIGQRKAIVEDEEGVTRDRLYADAEIFGKEVEMIDTGGIGSKAGIAFSEEIRLQTEIAIEEADLLVMVVDGTVGVTLQDEEVSRQLLLQKKPTFLAVNKVDSDHQELLVGDFYSLGISKLFAVSAEHGRGLADLLEAILTYHKNFDEEEEEDGLPRVAIVGRPNVGKSTLMNALQGEERCIVSDVPGTTRDAIDMRLGDLIFVDTAGIRKKKSEKEVVDKFAFMRTEKAIERAHIVILVLDSLSGMTTEEKRMATMIEEKGKGCIVFLNKWDLLQGFRMEHAVTMLERVNPFLAHAPIIVGSAKTGRNVDKLPEAVRMMYSELQKRISTGELNAFVKQAVEQYHPPAIQGRHLRIYYLTQTGVFPPTFIFFLNDKKLMTATYERYLHNQFRKSYGYLGVPLRFHLRSKQLTARKK